MAARSAGEHCVQQGKGYTTSQHARLLCGCVDIRQAHTHTLTHTAYLAQQQQKALMYYFLSCPKRKEKFVQSKVKFD